MGFGSQGLTDDHHVLWPAHDKGGSSVRYALIQARASCARPRHFLPPLKGENVNYATKYDQVPFRSRACGPRTCHHRTDADRMDEVADTTIDPQDRLHARYRRVSPFGYRASPSAYPRGLSRSICAMASFTNALHRTDLSERSGRPGHALNECRNRGASDPKLAYAGEEACSEEGAGMMLSPPSGGQTS